MRNVFKRLYKNEKGQMLPFITFMLIVLILFAALAISVTMMFMKRKVAEDALDAAVLSGAMKHVVETHQPTYHFDYLQWECLKWGEPYEDENGFIRQDCEEEIYRVVQAAPYNKNYIYVSGGLYGTIMEYFEGNLIRNAPDADIKNLKVEIEYDDERFLLIKKELYYMDPPEEINGIPVIGRSYNPSPWWLSAFSSSTNFMGLPESFTDAEEEERIVRYPRWVKISATAEVEITSYLGKLLAAGGDRTTITVSASVVRELIKVDRPVFPW